MNKTIIFLLAGGTLVLNASVALIDPEPKFVWNATASAPKGLYWAAPFDCLKPGTLLIVRPPSNIARFMDDRGYLPLGALLLKRIAALSGMEICRHSADVFVAGKKIAQTKDTDAQGRFLPQWSGCHRLQPDEIFLVNANVQDSLDGRYFGPFPKSSIVSLAYPIWVDDENDGHS
jgi:conjugative transfer signal peptidase TraF